MKQLFTYFSGFALKLVLVCSMLIGLNAAAQTYPVQTSIATTGPYLNYLSYYGDHNNHLQITVTNLNFSLPPVLVRLRLRIEGSGWELYTDPNATIGQPFLLEPGMPLTISGIELLPYLQQNNLINPNGIDLNDLPHGFTNICVDVIRESAQQQVLSTNNCGFLPIQEYQPPQAFTPLCGEQLDTAMMFHNFTWSPPVPFPAGADLELFYDFSIHHWIDPNNNAALGGNSILVYEQTDLIAPTTQVSDFDVQFEQGGTYVWKVTARVESNGIPVSLIENGGVSAPCTFVYGQALSVTDQLADGLEIELFTEPSSERKGKAWWTVTDNTPNQGLSNFDAFFVEYRKQPTGNEGFEIPWHSKTLTSFEHFIYQLEPSTTYEVKVSGVIAGTVGNPTPVKTFTTPDPRIYNCGEADLPYLPSNYTPLENATVGTQVQIGQFMMTLTELYELGGGHYTGKGTIPVAFLGGAKAKVRFDDILIDTEYRVHQGRVDVITQGLESWLDDQYQQFIDPYYVDGVVDSAWVDTAAGVAWVVVDGVNHEFTFDPPHYPIIVNDENGNQYTIYPNGTIVVSSYLAISETWAATADEVIHFSQNDSELRGFDPKEHMEWHENYEVMELADFSKYFVANKSLAKGEADKVNVEIPAGANASFQFSDGTPLPSSSLQGNWIGETTHTGSTKMTLSIPAKNSSGNYSIYALVNNQKVGQLNVQVYSKKERELVIVPITNVNLTKAQVEAELDQTLGEANIDVDVEIASQWTNSDFTDTSIISLPTDVGLLNKYSDEMSAVRDAYFYENDLARTDVYYLFLVAGFDDPAELGYMPRGKSYGFVSVNQTNVLNTISHELGHGMGALEHSWKENGPGALSTGNLMDYENNVHPEKANLTKAQWKELRDIDFVPNIWDDELDASSAISILSELTDSDEIANYVSEEKIIDKNTFPTSPVIAMSLGQYYKFSDDAWAKIESLKFTNGQLTGLGLFGENGETHDAILERTATHLLPKNSPIALRLVSSMTEDGYHFLCTHASHQNERGVENVVKEAQVIQVVSEGCDHDFSFGKDMSVVDCEDIIGTALVGYDANVFTMEYPICPDPSNSEFFYIPKSWRNKKDNSFCFMTPDGNILKTSAGGFRAVKYGIGLSALDDHSMLPSGCVIEFAHQSGINDDVITYKADIQNGVFKGYKTENGMVYFNSFKAAHAQDTGIMLLPDKDGLGVYYFDASQYSYVDSSSQGDAVLDISADYNSILGWGINSLSYVNYSTSDLAQLAIDSQKANELLSTQFGNQNNEHRLVAKIVELASAYPDLYTRMSKCPFRQWTGTACMNIGGLLNSIPFHNNPIAAALTDNGTWGYYDYMYDQNDYENQPMEEQLRMYIVHFKELIVANRLANQSTIQSILDTSSCNMAYTGTNSPSSQLEPEAIFNALNAMSADEIRAICLQTRINLIASLSFRALGVTNDYEKSIYKLIKYVDPNDAYDLVEGLCLSEYNNELLLKQIAGSIDDQVMFFGDDNYFSEIAKTLIKHYAAQPNELSAMNFNSLSVQEFKEFSKRLVTYNYTGVVKRLFTSCGAPALAGNGATMSNVTLTKGSGGWKIGFEDNLEICFTNVRSSNQRSFDLLDPLIISDDARLMSLNDDNGTAMIMPAFILYFLEEKAWAKSAVEAIETTVDAVSLFIPGGQGKLFFRVLNYADKVSSITNMGANYTQIDNPTLSSFLSITSGVLGLADLTGNGVANFRKVKNGSASEQEIFDLITRDQNKLSENHTKAVNDLLEVVDENTDVDLIKILGSEEAKAHFIELLEAEDVYLRQLGHTRLANDVKARVNTLKTGTAYEVVDVSLIQLINGSYPINAADFAGLNFSFDLVNNPRMRSIMEQRWQAQGLTAQEILINEQKFVALNNKYPNGVYFSPQGFPIFSQYRYIHNGVPVQVDIGALHPNPPSGVSASSGTALDFKAANDMMKQIDPNWKKPADHTWHHVENSTILELIPTDIHRAVRHSGGRSTYVFNTITNLSSAWKNGWSKQQVLAIAKGSRPKPTTYLDHSYVYNHVDVFNQEGGAFIVVQSWIENGNYPSFPLKKFVMLNSDMQNALSTYRQSGQISDLEAALGYNPGDLAGLENELYVFYPSSSEYKFAMPDGNEIGANNLWEPGGTTSGGFREAVLISKFDPSAPIVHNKSIESLKSQFNWEKL